MLKSNNFQHYKLSTLSFLNIKIPLFSFLKKAILGLHKNLFWHISRKIGFWKIFKRSHLKHYLSNKKYFQKVWWKWIGFLKKFFYWKIKLNQFLAFSVIYMLYIYCVNTGQCSVGLKYIAVICSRRVSPSS